MKRWVIFDNCTSSKSAEFEEVLAVESKEEAEEIARLRWNGLSEHDQRCRDAFYVGLVEMDEDGDFWGETKDVVCIK